MELNIVIPNLIWNPANDGRVSGLPRGNIGFARVANAPDLLLDSKSSLE
jgi:hypothetical protein